ncbi:MAG: serine hydrolase [Phycisphaerales bacterium]
MRRILAAVLLAALFALPAPAHQPASPGAEAQEVVIPSTPAGKQLAWVLGYLNNREQLGDPADRFAESFLKQVPGERLKTILESARATIFKNGAKLTRIKPDLTDSRLVALVQGGDALLEVSIVTDGAGKMEGLLLRPAIPPKVAVADWKEFDDKLAALPGMVSFVAYRVPQGVFSVASLKPINALHPEQCLATGSTFKLYILGALSEQILAGKHAWDEQVAIADALKSLPGGVMQDEPAGKKFPISEFAAKMISISDNTATDHLLHLTGREAVEAYQSFDSCSARNRPFLATMEMFRIKLAPDKSLAARYAAADESTRRALLKTEVAGVTPDLAFAEKWTKPIEIERIEWFSSANDLCNAMLKLHDLEQKPGMDELKRVLRINAGIPFDKKVWPSVAYKGGSEPGVLNLTWLMQREDGATFVASLGWNNKDADVETNTLVGYARAMVDLLAKEPK